MCGIIKGFYTSSTMGNKNSKTKTVVASRPHPLRGTVPSHRVLLLLAESFSPVRRKALTFSMMVASLLHKRTLVKRKGTSIR